MTESLIRKTKRKVASIGSYGGVCHECNSPICFNEEMIVIEIGEDADSWCVVPIDELLCPHCNKPMLIMRIYKNLEVSNELSQL